MGTAIHSGRGCSAVGKQMTAMTHGKAYFATPGNLWQFVLIDFLKRKQRRVR